MQRPCHALRLRCRETCRRCQPSHQFFPQHTYTHIHTHPPFPPPAPPQQLEEYIRLYGELLRHRGEPPVACKRVETVEEVLKEADVSAARGGGVL